MTIGRGPAQEAFAAFIGLALAAGYCLPGAGWLIGKTEGELQLAGSSAWRSCCR